MTNSVHPGDAVCLSVSVNGCVHTPCTPVYHPKRSGCPRRDEGSCPRGEGGCWQVMAETGNWSKIHPPKAGSHLKPPCSSHSQYCPNIVFLFSRWLQGCRCYPGAALGGCTGVGEATLGFLSGYFEMGRKIIEHRRSFRHLCPGAELVLNWELRLSPFPHLIASTWSPQPVTAGSFSTRARGWGRLENSWEKGSAQGKKSLEYFLHLYLYL